MLKWPIAFKKVTNKGAWVVQSVVPDSQHHETKPCELPWGLIDILEYKLVLVKFFKSYTGTNELNRMINYAFLMFLTLIKVQINLINLCGQVIVSIYIIYILKQKHSKICISFKTSPPLRESSLLFYLSIFQIFFNKYYYNFRVMT